ncbi:hypothetical protein EV359DRAFT_82008 [Lentinula novae-zelandiae]|nr:hypothetical protein EV359DRAFT_82008 [Lentinula novae-zelandiae]
MNHPPPVQDPPPPTLNQSPYAALYTPDRFYQTINLLHMQPLGLAARWPLTVHDGHLLGQPLPNHRFPLPEIVGGNSNMTRLNHVGCIPLTLARGINAGSRNRTQVATVVQEMTIGHNQFPRLRIVRRSNDLWFNLRNYAYMDSGHGWRTTGGGNPAIHSVLPLPDSPQQVNAIQSLWAWHQARCASPNTCPVENEQAVQDEVQKQLLMPLQLLLQTRYPMDLRLYIRQNLPIFWDQLKHSQLTNPEVFRGVDHDTSGNYPRWGRPTIETNLGRTIYKQKSAGYSDHILYLGANKQCVAAVVENLITVNIIIL